MSSSPIQKGGMAKPTMLAARTTWSKAPSGRAAARSDSGQGDQDGEERAHAEQPERGRDLLANELGDRRMLDDAVAEIAVAALARKLPYCTTSGRFMPRRS